MSSRIIGWSVTAVAFIVAAIVLFISGYDGYGGVFLAVAGAAAINLLPRPARPGS